MKYVGLQSTIRRNNMRTILLLVGFPVFLLLAIWLFFTLVSFASNQHTSGISGFVSAGADTSPALLKVAPLVVVVIGIWFAIAYWRNTSIISKATGATPLMRRDNPRVYNIVENLTMACGMPMPKVNVIDDPQLNAFASGVDQGSYTVTVTTGLLQRLNDDELAGVIGHELTHIRNRDTRLLIVSVVFVGILGTLFWIVSRSLTHIDWTRISRNNKGAGLGIVATLLIALLCIGLAQFFSTLTRFAISRKREYMADAGGAELCGNPMALASALRKISADPGLGDVKRDDIAQMYIINPHLGGKLKKAVSGLFSTHPSTEDRIRLLEQY